MRVIRNFVAWIMCCLGCGLIMAGAFRQELGMSIVGLVVAGLAYQLAD